MKAWAVAVTLGCEGGNCPTTYVSDRGTVLLQGARTSDQDVVEVPRELLERHSAIQGWTCWNYPTEPGWQPGIARVRGEVIPLDGLPEGIVLPAHETLVEIVEVVSA